MEQERFLEACRWATSRENTRQGIGTLGEKTLHSAVKYYFQPDPDMREVPVGPFVADALVDGGVVEVQTLSLIHISHSPHFRQARQVSSSSFQWFSIAFSLVSISFLL